MTATGNQSASVSSTLFVALELSKSVWKHAFACADHPSLRIRNVAAGDLQQFESELLAAKRKFELDDDAATVTCYEAGRDGFWIHRALETIGLTNHVIESASLEVDRRNCFLGVNSVTVVFVRPSFANRSARSSLRRGERPRADSDEGS